MSQEYLTFLGEELSGNSKLIQSLSLESDLDIYDP